MGSVLACESRLLVLTRRKLNSEGRWLADVVLRSQLRGRAQSKGTSTAEQALSAWRPTAGLYGGQDAPRTQFEGKAHQVTPNKRRRQTGRQQQPSRGPKEPCCLSRRHCSLGQQALSAVSDDCPACSGLTEERQRTGLGRARSDAGMPQRRAGASLLPQSGSGEMTVRIRNDSAILAPCLASCWRGRCAEWSDPSK
jgi:hypothetical protein